MIVKLLTENYLEFLSLKGAAEGLPSLHLSKCLIVGNLMPRLRLSCLQTLAVDAEYSEYTHTRHITCGYLCSAVDLIYNL